jgi:hypothetical protein
VVAALFLGRLGGDLTCAIGLLNGKPYLRERFPGALDVRYGSVAGSIYVLPAAPFVPSQTAWEEDWVSPQTVVPLREIRVANAREHLLRLAREARLSLFYYGDGVSDPAAEEESLVNTAVRKYARSGEEVLSLIQAYHPRLYGRIRQAIGLEGADTA